MLTRPLKKTAIGNPAAENRVESRIYPSDGYKYTTPRKKSLLFSATFRRFCYTRSKTPEIDGKVREIGRKRERLLIVKKEEKRNEKERFSKKEKRKGEREIVKKKKIGRKGEYENGKSAEKSMEKSARKRDARERPFLRIYEPVRVKRVYVKHGSR